jgi:hypothetical protein
LLTPRLTAKHFQTQLTKKVREICTILMADKIMAAVSPLKNFPSLEKYLKYIF